MIAQFRTNFLFWVAILFQDRWVRVCLQVHLAVYIPVFCGVVRYEF